MRKPLDAIIIIVIITVIVFLATFYMPGMKDRMFELLALYFPKNEKFKVWQLVTTMFMHAGFTHLLFNMYALWAFGTPLENIWGIKRFVFFYFVSGIGASAIYTLVNYYRFKTTYNAMIADGIPEKDITQLLETQEYNTQLFSAFSAEQLSEFYHIFHIPAVGASGAVYGILVAFGMLFPNAKLALIFLPFPIPAKYFIPILIALDLFSGVTGFSLFGGGIAHFAHVGGAVIGFLLMLYWRKGGRGKNDARVG